MKKSLIGFVETLVAGIFLALLIMIFVGQSLEITGDSMHPTLINKERVIVEKVTYNSRDPKRGEIVVFRSFQNTGVFLIKRVIGIPGDTLGLTNGKVTVNNSVLDESYLPGGTTVADLGVLKQYTAIPIPAGHFAVMGDNRSESYDSRMFGLVPLDSFVGKAFVVYWPLTSARTL